MARKILLADDSVTAQNMGRKILADAGYEVIAVNNGSAALKKIAELKPDLVILDVYMPGYSGLEVCQRLKESQETARIPVLLSVGKLEPFKPEEAQRVRADGFIVKPFEASELLSALSKLEDKVVPRAEPSKPGRFARAIAAAEESSRGTEDKSERSGWKSRIGFPHGKTEPAEKVASESSIYNSMNRDLRTGVETPAERAVKKEDKGPEAAEAAKTTVDVASLAPSGLPKDVTPEEVAAIAAAAAQIQMAGDVNNNNNEERGSSEAQIRERAETNVAPAPDAQGESLRDGKDESSIPAATATEKPLEVPEETNDVPVTMAAANESMAVASASRWKAVPVPLEGEDATIALDQEMQKAYAAFAAAVASSSVAGVPEASAESALKQTEAAESAIPAIPFIYSEPVPVAQPEAAVAASSSAARESASPSFATPDFATPNFAPLNLAVEERPSLSEPESSSTLQPEVAAPAPTEIASQETSPGTSAVPGLTEPNREPTPAEFMSPVSEAEVAGLAGIVGLGAERQLAMEAEAATVSSRSPTPMVNVAEPVAENAAEPAIETTPDPETVKSTAAAWANWRQTRDTGKDNGKNSESEAVQAPPLEPAVAESAPLDTAARAVAAGAEQISQEVPATAPNGNSGDVASIVDSVLADLRPKLMAEISRKMSEKK